MSDYSKLDKHYVDDVKFLVEANSFEALNLWSEYKDRGFITENTGLWMKVGELGDMPICVSLIVGNIQGVKFILYHPTSVVVDYRIIDEFFRENYEDVKKIDAMNFGQVVNAKGNYLQYEGKSN